jgi:hypothetical protein
VTNCKEKAFQILSAFIYLDKSERTKYRSLITGLQTQQSLGNNQYPTTITEANNILSSHRFDNPSKKFTKKDKDKSNDENEERIELSFSQMEGQCYSCGKSGHKSPNCNEKGKPKSEWAINKAKEREHSCVTTKQMLTQSQLSQGSDTVNVQELSSRQEELREAWSGAQV